MPYHGNVFVTDPSLPEIVGVQCAEKERVQNVQIVLAYIYSEAELETILQLEVPATLVLLEATRTDS